MKPFVFRLASVLTLRTREEERAQQTFGKAVQLRNQAALALDESRAALDTCYCALQESREFVAAAGSAPDSGAARAPRELPAAGAPPLLHRTEQILLLNSLQQQQAHSELLTARLAAADREVAARRGDFLTARRKREALTRLRDRQRIEHHIAAERATENEVADLITARHFHALREVAV